MRPDFVRRRSLRSALWLSFLPLGAVAVASVTLVLLQVRRVHHDVQRIFEEHREVALSRSLLEEIRGIEQWTDLPSTPAPTAEPLILADIRRHLDEAVATLQRFATDRDPSGPVHAQRELVLRQQIERDFARIQQLLGEPGGPAALAAPVRDALRAAQALADAIAAESKAIGQELDQRSEDMVRLVLVLGAGTAGTFALLAFLLARYVLRPIELLQRSARAFGEGQVAIDWPTPGPDELGELAATFRTMAARLRRKEAELEQRVEQRSKEVLRSARLADLGTLAAGIAHEINNPLAAIAACAEGLLRDHGKNAVDPARTRDYLAIVAKEAGRARDITGRLLRFARHDQPRREPVHLEREAREVAAMLGHQMASRQVTLRLEIADELPLVLGDPAEWRQVLLNLMKNALDASPDGGVIGLRLDDDDGRVVLQVSDQGPGIPVADRERVFEPFFTTKAPGQGTGLGLAISHRIITECGGHVAIGEQQGGGAVITVDLPAHRSA